MPLKTGLEKDSSAAAVENLREMITSAAIVDPERGDRFTAVKASHPYHALGGLGCAHCLHVPSMALLQVKTTRERMNERGKLPEKD